MKLLSIRDIRIMWINQVNYMSFSDYLRCNFIGVYNEDVKFIGYEENNV